MPMDSGLKQRLLGAAVLVALAVIFLPMLIKDPAPDSEVSELSFTIPAQTMTTPEGIQLPQAATESGPGEAIEDPDPAREDTAPVAADSSDAAELNTDPPANAEATASAPEADTALPPSAANGKYVVHFASFAARDSADLVVRDLHERGLSAAFSETADLNGRSVVRVRIGPYATQAEAEIVRVRAAQVRSDVQPRVFMLIDEAAAERTAAALEQASPPAATTGVGFVVQLGAFSDASRASALQERLRKAGVVAFTDTVNTAKGRLTRVNAGPVSSRREANQLKARVKSAIGIEGVVRAHP